MTDTPAPSAASTFKDYVTSIAGLVSAASPILVLVVGAVLGWITNHVQHKWERPALVIPAADPPKSGSIVAVQTVDDVMRVQCGSVNEKLQAVLDRLPPAPKKGVAK